MDTRRIPPVRAAVVLAPAAALVLAAAPSAVAEPTHRPQQTIMTPATAQAARTDRRPVAGGS
jgi:hypothetical protein